CGDQTVRAWDTGTGREKHDLELEKGTLRTPALGDAATSLAVTPVGKFLLALARPHGEIDVFNAIAGKKVQSLKGHPSFIYALAFTPEARTLVACFGDRTVEVWDVAAGKKLRQFSLPADEGPNPGGAVFSAALSPDGKLLAFGSQTRFLVLKDMITGEDIR